MHVTPSILTILTCKPPRKISPTRASMISTSDEQNNSLPSSQVHEGEEIIYGVPIEENLFTLNSNAIDVDIIADCVYAPSTEVTYALSDYCFDYCSDSDFHDVIEILAHANSDDEEKKIEQFRNNSHNFEKAYAVTASPIATPIYNMDSLTYSYAVPGYSLDSLGKEIEALPVKYADRVTLLDASSDNHHNHIIVTEIVPDKFEYFQQDYYDAAALKRYKSLQGTKRPARKNDTIPSQLSSSTSHPRSYDHGSKINQFKSENPSDKLVRASHARQKATAKREREKGGKFKKSKTKWVSVTELFQNNS